MWAWSRWRGFWAAGGPGVVQVSRAEGLACRQLSWTLRGADSQRTHEQCTRAVA